MSGGKKGGNCRQGTIGRYFGFVGIFSGGFEVTVLEVEVETADIGFTEAAMKENIEEVDVGTEGTAFVVGVAAEAAIVGVVATEASE